MFGLRNHNLADNLNYTFEKMYGDKFLREVNININKIISEYKRFLKDSTLEDVKRNLRGTIDDWKNLSSNKDTLSEISDYILFENRDKWVDLFNTELKHYLHLSFPTACMINDDRLINRIVDECEVDYNVTGYKGYTGLTYAIINGNERLVRKILSHPDVDVNTKDSFGILPIFRAFYTKSFGILKELINYPGADLSVKDINEKSLLELCIETQQLLLVNDLLLTKYFKIEDLGDHANKCFSELMMTKESSNQLLKELAYSCNVNYIDDSGNTLAMALLTVNYKERLDLVLKSPKFDPSLTNLEGDNLLTLALKTNDPESSRKVLDYIDTLDEQLQTKILNQENVYGQNCIGVLISQVNANYEALERLLGYEKLNVNSGFPLTKAIKKNDAELCNYLVERKNLDVNTLDPNGLTPLMSLIVEIDLKGKISSSLTKTFLKVLNRPDIEINKKNRWGDSAITMALKRKHNVTYEEQGKPDTREQSDPIITYTNMAPFPSCYTTPESMRSQGEQDLTDRQKWNSQVFFSLLKREDIDVNTKDIHGNSLLHLTIRYNDFPLFNKLLEYEYLNLNAINENGENALIYGCKNCRDEQKSSKYEARMDDVNSNIMKPYQDCGFSGMSNPNSFSCEYSMGTPITEISAKSLAITSANSSTNNDSTGEQFIEYFLEKLIEHPEFDRNCQDYSGYSLLHILLKRGFFNQFIQLAKCPDLNIDQQDCFGNTPLMYAVENGVKYYKHLLELGCDKETVNFQEKGPRDFATSEESKYTYDRLCKITVPVSKDSSVSSEKDQTKKGWIF